MTASHAAEIRCHIKLFAYACKYAGKFLCHASSRLPLHSLLLCRSSQVDQLRSELMQERSARHDLEMDKSALERQVLFIGLVNASAHTFTRTV